MLEIEKPRFSSLSEYIFDNDNSVSEYINFKKTIRLLDAAMEDEDSLKIVFNISSEKLKERHDIIYAKLYDIADKMKPFSLVDVILKFKTSNIAGLNRLKMKNKKYV